MKMIFNLHKMKTVHSSPIEYSFNVDGEVIRINDFIGKPVHFKFLGEINCVHCGKKTKKSFGGGYCYPHFASLPECDICIVRPEKCHFADGTCRDDSWGKDNCFREHTVYLANSSSMKVGITRNSQIPTRWMDQGATTALPILQVPDRFTSGIVETMIAKEISDKTNWRKMLKNEIDDISLADKRDELFEKYKDEFNLIKEMKLLNEDEYHFEYPVLEYPTKIKSVSFDKQEEIGGVLQGIKGQYLIFEDCVVNIRKHAGYKVEMSLGE